MSKLIKLTPNAPSEKIIEQLEHLLDLAKEGKIVSLAWAAEQVEHKIRTGWSGDADQLNVYALAGALEEAKLRLMGRFDIEETAELLSS